MKPFLLPSFQYYFGIILLTVTLSSGSLYANITHYEDTGSHVYSGTYEGYIEGAKNINMLKFSGKKLVRIQLYRYKYIDAVYRQGFDRQSGRSVDPHTVIGKIEEYDNKRGNKKPIKVTYFVGAGYDVGELIELDFIKLHQQSNNGAFYSPRSYRNSNSNKFPQIRTNQTRRINFLGYSGEFRKVSTFSTVPNSFGLFFNNVLEKSASRSFKRLNFGTLRGKNIYIHTKDYKGKRGALNLEIYGRNTAKFNSNPSSSWLSRLESEIRGCIKNGGYEHLRYMPWVNQLNIYIPKSYSYGTQDDNNELVYTVKINRPANEKMSIEFVNTSFTNVLIAKAEAADQKRALKAAQEREARERAAAERKRREQLAQAAERRSTSGSTAGFGSSIKLNTYGLNNAAVFKSIFEGKFEDIPFNREESIAASFVNNYMYAKANESSCVKSMTNATQIMEQRCVTIREKYNGTTECADWETYGTGLYSSRALYNAREYVSRLVRLNIFSTYGQMISGKMSLSSMLNKVGDAASFQADMPLLIRNNSCGGKAIQVFEENLIAFVYGNQPVYTKSGSTAFRSTGGVDYAKEQNYTRFVSDLLYADSKTWMFELVHYSVVIKNISYVSGRNVPSKIEAFYVFKGETSRTKDIATITFENGSPKCIYYKSDFIGNCKSPDRKVVAKLRSGAYVK